ncbi:hypothetical protein F4776DRAFT_633437 [Hypoxylon sp. NC0597]|nr:hypothetical protein F4776DRAFT_633437 [Hypoxylon sp. NC0597]
MPADMGPVILLQTANPIHEILGQCLFLEPIQANVHQGAYVNTASQEDDGFVFITFVYAVILSWDIEPTYYVANTLLSIGSFQLVPISIPPYKNAAYARTLLSSHNETSADTLTKIPLLSRLALPIRSRAGKGFLRPRFRTLSLPDVTF